MRHTWANTKKHNEALCQLPSDFSKNFSLACSYLNRMKDFSEWKIIQQKIIYKFHFEKKEKKHALTLRIYFKKNILSEERLKLCF